MRRIYHQGERAPTVKVLLAARRLRSRPLIAYPIAFGLAGFFFALQYFDQQHFVGTPFLTLYPAVVAACFIAGTPAGLIIAALDGVMQWWLFIPTVQWLAVLTYTFDALLCVMVLRVSQSRLRFAAGPDRAGETIRATALSGQPRTASPHPEYVPGRPSGGAIQSAGAQADQLDASAGPAA